MDAIAEKHTFGVNHEVLEIGTFAITLIGIQHGLDGLADAEVVLEVLVGENVATAFGSFAQIIEVSFLLHGKLIPVRDLVAHDAQVGELIYQEGKFLGLFVLCWLFRGTACESGCQSNTDHQFFHYFNISIILCKDKK